MIVLNFPVNIYLLKINNRNTRKSCEVSSKYTTKAQGRSYRLLHIKFETLVFIFFVYI